MSDFIDLRLAPGLWLLGDWSLRWAVLIAALGVWFALCPPRQAALRLAVCQFVLLAGLALPLVPRWWGQQLLPARWVTTADDVASEQATIESPEPRLRPSLVKPKMATVSPPSGPTASAEQNRSDTTTMESSSSALVPVPEPLGARRIFLLMVAALWSVGVCVQLIRLIAGAIGLSRLAHSALQPSPQSQELFDRCCKEIGLRRRVRLGLHPALRAPVFVGGWRSWVLVPTDWEQLITEAQRAVLWHELAHVARRDDWAKLVEQTIRALFFFHPLVYWLLNRIDAYREQVCDAAAVQHGVAGRRLAQILVDFSRRSGASVPRESAMRPALPFFRRRTVKNRIRELLEEKTVARWSAPLVRHQIASLVVIAVSIGFALGGFGARASESQSAPVQLAALDPPAKSIPSPAPEKAPETTKGPALPTLERILANWKARQERTRSLYFSWESRLFEGKAAKDRSQGKASLEKANRFSQIALWAERPYRFRLDSAHSTVSAGKVVFVAKAHFVRNGLTELDESPGNPPGLALAGFSKRRGGSPLETYAPALTLAFHPQDAFVLYSRSRPFRVVNENALKDRLHCVQIQIASNDGKFFENCWVDPARDDVVVAYESWRWFNDLREPNSPISIEYQPDRAYGWVPARWTVGNRTFRENTVSKYAINERFPEETFSLKVSPGTVVFDERTCEQYRVAADGGKSDLVQFDSQNSLRIHKVLQSISDIRIEPQSLQDAIEFIAVRYQIPILLKKADFDAAGIDTSAEVVDRGEGIRVADLLKSLLAQVQKPAGFRIEDEVLKVSPKFTEQGALRVRPAPPLPKAASRKERKIQEALEMPVDFTIAPQPLKDALDWIEARYQIRIESDPLMDSLIEVHGSFPGIKLRSLLSILLEQCPGKPLGFKIERDVLKIYSEAETPRR
jgi:beta-lactamase regulating signal transducer with metallopeptidase domain